MGNTDITVRDENINTDINGDKNYTSLLLRMKALVDVDENTSVRININDFLYLPLNPITSSLPEFL